MEPAEAFFARYRDLLARERAAAREQFEAARAAGAADAATPAARWQVAETTTLAGGIAWSFAPAGGGEAEVPAGPGDPVRVLPRRRPDEPIRGLVARRTRRTVSVVFDEPPPWPDDGEFRLDREWDDTTHQRLATALDGLESGRGRTAEWRRLVLGESRPRFDRPRSAEDPRLNAVQNAALARALAAPDFFLVHGPPGTGKTEVLAAVGDAVRHEGATLLCCAPSNAAVDNLVARLAARGLDPIRLGHPARVHPGQAARTLEARVEAHEKARVAAALVREARELQRRADRASRQGRGADRFGEARASRAQAGRLFAEARSLVRAAEDEIVADAPVVCATLTGLSEDSLRGRRFDLALVDEATQATLPGVVPALLRADRAVFAGDPNQLPPTVIDPEAARRGLSASLHERWQASCGPDAVQMLEVQHRMHAEIMRFPSRMLYGGRLRAHESVAAHLLADLPGVRPGERTRVPVVFLDTAGRGWSDERPGGSESRRNPAEAERVASEVRALVEAGVAPADVGVVTPYAAQVALLSTLLPDERLEIDTVDAFQGREKEAICVSLVRSNDEGEVGFPSDVRRMNVALTRARRRLFVAGDSATAGCHPFCAAFAADAQERGFWRSAWEEG